MDLPIVAKRVFAPALIGLAFAFLAAGPVPSLAQANLNGCSSYVPGPGDTIVCSSAYAASTSGVQTPDNNTGNNNVTVTIDSSAVRSINGSTVGIGSGSTVNNAGSLNTQSFFYGYGISFGANGRSQAGGNAVTNSGSITTGGTYAAGILIRATNATAASNSITNTSAGTIGTTGSSAPGLYVISRALTTISNAGQISASGSNSVPILVSGPTDITNSSLVCAGSVSGSSCNSSTNGAAAIQLGNPYTTGRSTVTNNSGGVISSPNGIGINATNAGVDIANGGTIAGSSTAIQFFSGSATANNTVTLYSGSSTTGAILFNEYGSTETLTFSGLSNANFSNRIIGLNTINATGSANVTMTSASGYTLVGGTINVDGTSSLSISGAITDQATPAGQSSITKSGAGTLTLAGANTYTGATSINAGTLRARATNTLPSMTFVILAAGAVLDLNSYSQAVASFSGAGNTTLGSGTLTLGGANTDTLYSGIMSGAGGLTKVGTGTFSMSGANTYTGTTAINAGTLLLTGALASPTTIASGATLAGTGTINGAVTNAGILAPGLGTSEGAFTIVGNYTSSNGVLATNIWGTPAAPQADRLVVSGNGSVASGTTQILATDRGGLGAPTTGDGIVIVSAQNGAVTQAGAFTLGQRVAAGAYEYSLHRGGSSAGSGQNWYLRTTIDPATSSGGAMPQPLPPADPNATTPAAPVSATAEVTNYRVETAVYPGLQVAQRLYTYSLVDTLDQRRGSLSAQTPGAASVPGGWGRVAGVLGSTRVGETVGPNLSYNYGFLQTGLDLFAGQTTTGGVQFAGVFVAVGQSSATTATASRGQTGQFGSNAYTVGLYATRFEANGLYADGLLQATRFAQSKASSVGGASLATDGWSGSASLEAGWRMGLAQHFYVVPQLQIVGDTFALNNATDAYGLMDFQNQTALRGRIGLLGGATFNGDQPDRAVNVWLRASAWNVFAGGPKTSFETFAGTNGVIFQSHYGSSWLGLDGGVTAQLSKQSALYANAGYDYGFGLARQAFTGRIGLQAQW
ncbi:autotransporter outer membrane beta-barrel domain-containing protein [Rhizobiales bacterium TNE-4]|nr:autotransporter outer membrane beta-barrel domain-containing protein [Rhizobiales bacterium TNE-4]MBV1828905.1 autotransporter outer membrane beta-barrel domain-containing protein [Rhizobiales bacterium TNE-4]